MRDLNEDSITAAVLERFDETPDPRLHQILQSLVRHLHGFVREVEPSFAEWEQAIGFLTAVGHMCDDKRQEFILLSDTLGVSMLVDAINHRLPEGATPTTVLGPFFVENAPELPLGADGRARGEGRAAACLGGGDERRRRADRGCAHRHLAFRRGRLLRRAEAGQPRRCAPASARMARESSTSGPPRPPPIPCRATGRSAPCCDPPAAT
jgi:hypothetical protein